MKGSSTKFKREINSLLEEAYTSRVSNLKQSVNLTNKALLLCNKYDFIDLKAKCYNQLSLFYMVLGNYKNAIQKAKAAIAIFKELKNDRGIADAKYNMAGVFYKTDNYHLGLLHLIDCLNIYRKYHDHHNMARVHKSLGTIYEFFNDQKNAIKTYKNAIKAAKHVSDLNLESNVYNPLSGIYLNQNKITLALELIEKSIEIKKQTGDIRGYAFALYGRGKIYIITKEFIKAEKDLKESLQIHEEMGEILGKALALYKMGALYVEMGSFDKAKKTLQRAIEFSIKYKIAITHFKCNFLLYKIYQQENKPKIAIKYLEEYITQKEANINTQTLKVIENYELLSKMETIQKEALLKKEKAEILEKKNRAEQKAKIKQDFLSTMSHEIRTPLNAVITIASLLEEEKDKEKKQLIDSLKFASNNLLFIVNDILDFSKLDSGKMSVDNRPTPLKKLLENIKNTYLNIAKEKGLDLQLIIDKSVGESYEIDDTKLSQILGNLITNALKFTEKGQVVIKVDKINEAKKYHKIRFSLVDSGIGIPKNLFHVIFDSFTQPKSITTRKHGGTGLGLAIVKKLIHLLDSEIYVESVINVGSKFYFDLDLTLAKNTIHSKSSKSTNLKNKKVLLAEDNLINALVANKLLAQWGMISDHAKNGLEAVEMAKSKKYDFILMDIHMPEMDGNEASKIIKNTKNLNKNTPLFALTADISSDNENMPYFDGILNKPIEIEKLFATLNE